MAFIKLTQADGRNQPICIAVDKILAFFTVEATYDKSSFSVIDCGNEWSIRVTENTDVILAMVAESEKAKGGAA